jgi:hypothetical protein
MNHIGSMRIGLGHTGGGLAVVLLLLAGCYTSRKHKAYLACSSSTFPHDQQFAVRTATKPIN